MSPSSRESNLAQLREALAQLNSELFLTLGERRRLCVRIQEYKVQEGSYSHFDPEREKELFSLFHSQLKLLSLKETLAFSLIMEDQAMAMAPGSYPTWSSKIHLSSSSGEIFEMINPLMLKVSRPDFFKRLILSPEFSFLNDL